MRYKTVLAIMTNLATAACTAAICASVRLAHAEEPGKAAMQRVPFKLAKEDKPLILLETIVDGKGPFRFVLDTGAGGTVISPDLAKKLEIKPDKHQKADKATGAGGTVDIRVGTVKSLQVGQTRVGKLTVGIMDLAGISKALETEIDGILGYDFLKTFRVTIDYPKRTVTFE